MRQNHLIIGLGGTGGKILRAFKKTILQEFRTEKPDKVNIEYLYVDSSSEMMALDDPSWKILGKSVQLGKHQQLLIQGANLSAQLESINNFPGIKSWIGSKEQWRDILNSIVGEVLGGQKRRLGRFLFACKVKEFRQQVQNLVRELQQKGSTSITFHICSGLAGGTGSGSLIDVLSQIREMYPDSRMHRIIVYTLLPDTHPKPNWDTGNYHANGYAGLMELNSFSVGAWQPHDITGNKDRLKLQDPFNGCYLFYNENENGLSVDVSKDIPSIVADFLYQKLVAVDELSWSTLSRMENAENGDGTPECTPDSRQGERSKRFLSFGIKRLVVPEEEIREYMTYNFARQTTLQMLFNNWSDSIGFLDEARNQSFREFVDQKEVQQNWMITDEHLCLSAGILPDEIGNKKWKPINIDWQELIPNLKEVVRQQDAKTSWLAELSKKCEDRFDQKYRGLGVRKFYEIKTATRKDHARQIRGRIESDIFEEWKNGSRSAHEIGQLLDALLTTLEGRGKILMDEKMVRAKENAEATSQKITANNVEWVKIGILSAAFGKRNNMLDAQATCLEEHYVHRTRFEGWQFAKGLIQELITEITSLRNEVTRFASLVTEAIKECDDRIAERCSDDGGQTDLRKPLVQFYNPSGVREFTRQLTHDKRVQQTQANDVRLSIIEQLGEHPDFTTLNARMPKQRLIDILEVRCEQGAVNAHNNLIASNKAMARQLGVSIIEKLYKEYGGNEEGLKKYIHDLVSRAGNYLIFDPLEANKVGPGIPSSPSKISQFTVIMPKAPEWATFMTTLKEIFRGSLTTHMEIIESDAKPNEIAFISITNLFPLRFAKQLGFLRERYEARISGADSARNKLELHCEGEGFQHPKLFVLSGTETIYEGLPYLLLAKALGTIQQQTSPTTGKSELVLLTKDADGFDNPPVKLGLTLVESVEKIDAENIEVIRRTVQKALDQDFIHVEKQAELRKRVVGEVEEIKAERKGDIDDPVYKRFLEAGKRAVKLVAREG
jgi:hypothetical protein